MIKILLLNIVFLSSCVSKSKSFEWVENLPSPWMLEDDVFESYLVQFHNRYPDFHQRLKAINLWRIGTPYGLYCLGEENEQDPDPIIRHDSSDCTVHVLTSLAFAKSLTYKEARMNMIDFHYKPDNNNLKVPSYNRRWHFTSDRLLNHPYTVDFTSNLVDLTKIEKINIDLNRKENDELFLDLNWTSNVTIEYIPSNMVDIALLSSLPSICGVAFVKKDYFKLGIVIAHEGYLINRTNLIHASSEFKKTVDVNFINYLKNNEKYRFDGVMFFEIKSM